MFVIEGLCLKIEGADQHKITSAFPGFPLGFPDQRGGDSLMTIGFFHPQVNDYRGLPFFCNQNTPAQKATLRVCDLINEHFFLHAFRRRCDGVRRLIRLFFDVFRIAIYTGYDFVLHFHFLLKSRFVSLFLSSHT